ncbi:unnamed protein product [Caenorhabditis nigoni]
MNPHIIKFTPVRDRTCHIDLAIHNSKLRIIQAYAPTAASDDQDYDDFLTEIRGQYHQDQSNTIISGDNRKSSTTSRIRPPRFSAETIDLFKTRSSLLNKTDPRSQIELVQTNKALRFMISKDIEARKFQKYENAVSSKTINEQTTTPTMWELLKVDGTLTSSSEQIKKTIQNFYGNLYKSSIQVQRSIHQNPEEPPEVLESEVEHHLKRMKLRKAPGHDQINNAMLRNAAPTLIPHLKEV